MIEMSWENILKNDEATTLLHYYLTKLSDAYSSNNSEELKKVVNDIISEMGDDIVQMRYEKSD